jgi:hypothetical protein
MNIDNYRRRAAINRSAAMVDGATTTATDNQEAVAHSKEESSAS